MAEEAGYVRLFDRAIRRLFRDGLRISPASPARIWFLLRALGHQARAARRRRYWAGEGLHVPAFMIISVTSRCNLNCRGCYARAHSRGRAEMDSGRLRALLSEARDLGISIVLLAGGEPLTRPEILDLAGELPEIVFPLFTNGLLLNEAIAARLRRMRHVIPVLSLEGREAETDERRGAGIHERLRERIALLGGEGVFFGISFTVTCKNWKTVTDREFLAHLLAAGCRLFFFVDYVPAEAGTEDLVIAPEERPLYENRLLALRSELPALFIALPGDEEKYGGCLAAGRGFIHVSPDGRLEPCPFAPFSDTGLAEGTLREALSSPLLRKIREHGHELTETGGGCALWAKRDWLASLLEPGQEGHEQA